MQFLGDMVGLAVIVRASVLAWRSAGNTSERNLAPLLGVSPIDVLCLRVTSLFIGFYTAFRRPLDTMRFEQARVLLALVSFVINVITI